MHESVTLAVAALLTHSLASHGRADRHARRPAIDRAAPARDVGRLAGVALAAAPTGVSLLLPLLNPETGWAA